jgi:hypothetical protein
MSETRKAKRAARHSKRDADRRELELHPERDEPIAELPPLHEMQAFAQSVQHLRLRDAVDHFIDWLDERIEVDLPGDGPMAKAGEALLEGLSDMGIRAFAQMLIRQAARVPVVDRRHP